MMCRELLKLLQIKEKFDFVRVVTEDESWLDFNYSHPKIWSSFGDEFSVRLDQINASEKHILTALWFIKSPLVIEWLGQCDKHGTP
jgi:hypothetical protein